MITLKAMFYMVVTSNSPLDIFNNENIITIGYYK
jgi:hypothetical protein